MNTTLLFLLMLRICQLSAHRRASVTVSPLSSQHFEYNEVSVSCENFTSGEWTVWRYTNSLKVSLLSQCGTGWGSKTSSGCTMSTAKSSDSGVYWCQSKQGDSSSTINITVTGSDKSVILQSPVLPVMEGDDVTLRCQRKGNPSNHPADFYKNGAAIKTEPTGQMTLHNFSRSDESTYTCRIEGQNEESPPQRLAMKDSDSASLTVSPSWSQMFEYKNVSLTCSNSSSSHKWQVIRAVSTETSGDKLSLQSCGENWGTLTKSGCILQTAKKPDSGIYWCESPAKQRSNSVNITVHGGPVILQSPVLPVMEGDDVTLSCRTKNSSSLPAAFYKDGSIIRTEPSGHMTIHRFSRSNEGFYKCHISGHGESPPSWISVTDRHGTVVSTTDLSQSGLRVICHLVVFCPYCISTVLLVSLYRQRPKGRNLPVSMTTSPPREDDERLDQPYDDVSADVITEHHF